MEKSFEGTFATELEGAFAQRSDSVSLTGLWEYRIADKNTVEASVETWVSSLLYSRESVSYLSSAGMGENAQPYPHQPQLLVYYASPGERLWDIAQKPPGAALGFAGAERPVRGYAAGRPAPDNL